MAKRLTDTWQRRQLHQDVFLTGYCGPKSHQVCEPIGALEMG